MPPSDEEALYSTVAWRGDSEALTPLPYGPGKHRWRLYSTQLFQALLPTVTKRPARQTIIVNQSCLSEGQARYLFHPPLVKAFATHDWPVLHISTAAMYEPSLGSFWDGFLSELSKAVEQPTRGATLGQVRTWNGL